MERMLTVMARLLALFFALLFVLTTALVITAFIARFQLLRAEPYKQALLAVGAYERTPAILAEMIARSGAGPGGAFFLSLEQADYEILLRHLMPAGWLQQQAESVVDQSFAVMQTGGNGPVAASVTISLVELKQRLNSETGAQALGEIVARRPACAEGDLAALTCGFGLDGALVCRPPDLTLELCGATFSGALAAAAATLPDQVALATLLQIGAPIVSLIRQALAPYLTIMRYTLSYGWLLSILLLCLVTLFGVRSFRGWLRWWGVPLLSVGFVLFPVALFTWLFPTWFLRHLITEMSTFFPPLGQLLGDIVAVLGQRLALWLGGAGLVVAALGLLMALLSFLVPGSRAVAEQR